MSWILAFLGFSLLIILHEAGHFVVAKAVGMRVERFSLFFPPLIWRRKGKGETEYAIGSIPLGGYVKISGMTPHEELPPGEEHRAYFRQPVWKRVAVIIAGPVVNIAIALILLIVIILHTGTPTNGGQVAQVQPGQPATKILKPGDRILAVDGRTGDISELSRLIALHRCPGKLTPGCKAATPVRLTVRRGSETRTIAIRPAYDAELKRMRLGFTQDQLRKQVGVGEAVTSSASEMARFTGITVTTIGKVLFSAQDRKQVSGVIGSYETARQAVKINLWTGLYVLAVISLSLGVI
ncbi:MAG: regulator of sigma protease, partial [Solirubrobacteraceae bacterium]|nr:regulator of sigma protease [Solirubrobacteraceae bacterium]